MVNYSFAKIYKIEPITGGEEGDVYVGSTAAPLLSIRMSHHRSTYKRWQNGKGCKLTSYILFEKYGVDNCHIVLLESVNANNKDELFARERYWIQSLRCVNKNISGRTSHEWRDANKDDRNIKGKLYYQEHSEAIRIRNKHYYLDNKEHILERCRLYRLDKRNTES